MKLLGVCRNCARNYREGLHFIGMLITLYFCSCQASLPRLTRKESSGPTFAGIAEALHVCLMIFLSCLLFACETKVHVDVTS